RAHGGGIDRRAEASVSPVHKLTAEEREAIVKVATSAEYRDLSPRQIVPLLADQGIYVASESSFYRVLHEHELMATGSLPGHTRTTVRRNMWRPHRTRSGPGTLRTFGARCAASSTTCTSCSMSLAARSWPPRCTPRSRRRSP